MPLSETQLLYAAVGAVVFLLVLLVASVRRVPQGFEYTVERNGRFRRVLRPGLSFLVPGLDWIGARQDMRERQLEVSVGDVLGRDRIPVAVEATIFYQVEDAAKASYEVEDVGNSLRALVTVTLRRLVGERELDSVLADRAALGAALLAATDESAAVWGLRLLRTEVGRLQPPAELVEAAAEARTAELRARGEANAAQAVARARREASEVEREAVLSAAQAQADAARIAAEADERVAEGEARSALMLSRAVDEGDVRALNYLLARQYVDAIGALARSDNGRFVVLPLENGGISASLTGIRELAEESFARPGPEGTSAQDPAEDDAAADAVAEDVADEPEHVADELEGVADELEELAAELEQDSPMAAGAPERITAPATIATFGDGAGQGPAETGAEVTPQQVPAPAETPEVARAATTDPAPAATEAAPAGTTESDPAPSSRPRSGGFWGWK